MLDLIILSVVSALVSAFFFFLSWYMRHIQVEILRRRHVEFRGFFWMFLFAGIVLLGMAVWIIGYPLGLW